MITQGFGVTYNDIQEVTYWYSGESNSLIWSTESSKALRFIRKEDAQRFITRFISIPEAVPSFYIWED